MKGARLPNLILIDIKQNTLNSAKSEWCEIGGTNLQILYFLFQSALATVTHLPESEKIIRVALGSMLELLKQESFVELTVREILWGYENKLIQLSRSIFPEGEGYPFDEFGLFKGKNGTVSAFMQTW